MRVPLRKAYHMTGKLPPSASVATPVDGARLHAPAASRNAQALCDLLRAEAPHKGRALEIASGTGQHLVAFARTLPELIWQPTDIDPARLASITEYTRAAALPNIHSPARLDAAHPGWARQYPQQNLIITINLVHLISATQVQTVLTEAMKALTPGGRFILYGPFMRDGVLTSAGDARFHTELSAADPAIGYKNDSDIERWLGQAGAHQITRVDMPANNLAFIAAP